MTDKRPVLPFNGHLTVKDFEQVLFHDAILQMQDDVLNVVDQSFDFLKSFSENKVIYGVNTGFGPMAQYKIQESDQIQLQYNLIRSHASGTGNQLEPIYIRAAMLARLNTLCLGRSGVHKSVVLLMVELINRNIMPLIFEHGGVGASGDLVQLAHLSLALIGEGEVHYQGELRKTEEVFKLEA